MSLINLQYVKLHSCIAHNAFWELTLIYEFRIQLLYALFNKAIKIKIKLAIQKSTQSPCSSSYCISPLYIFFLFYWSIYVSPLLFEIKIPINIHFNYVHHDDNNNNNKSLLYLSHSLSFEWHKTILVRRCTHTKK